MFYCPLHFLYMIAIDEAEVSNFVNLGESFQIVTHKINQIINFQLSLTKLVERPNRLFFSLKLHAPFPLASVDGRCRHVGVRCPSMLLGVTIPVDADHLRKICRCPSLYTSSATSTSRRPGALDTARVWWLTLVRSTTLVPVGRRNRAFDSPFTLGC